MKGSTQNRTPVASLSALPSAAATGLYGLSLIDFAPNGPIVVLVPDARRYRVNDTVEVRASVHPNP